MAVTHRERVLAALRHEVPDRTPAEAWFHDEVVRKLKEHYRTDDWEEVLADLGLLGWKSAGLKLRVPEFEDKAERRSYRQMTRRGIWRDERTYENEWGMVHRIGESGWYEEWVGGPLLDADGEDPSAVEKLSMPGVGDIDEPADYPERVAGLKAEGNWVSGGISNPYKTLADYLINREFLEALYDRLYALYTEMAVRMVRAGADEIRVVGDIAMQDRIIMGPDTWREVDKPRMAKLIAACKQANPEVFLFIHTDGNATDLLDDLVEIGF
ncbi:MAG: uroporphyrinogen decarboxylase family protein, partial [Planctomycetota bacterium]